MTIKLTNSLTKEKESFKPINETRVSIYTCGPTVYNYAHIGNLRAYVFADVLKRVLKLNGYFINQVINITDVGHLTSDEDAGEDKLEKGAKREGKNVWEIAKYYTKAFFNDLRLLNIEEANHYPRATDHIGEMIEMIKKLEKNGFTYVAGGNVYFNSKKFGGYGKMANLNLSPESAKSRVEQDPNKKSPFDFVLWFTKYKYSSHEMQWDSPWGKGFPGWHIECSAMAIKYLGEHIDIHTGGIDHISVHHTNEIAQSEAALGHKWVNYWLHNDFLTVKEGEKMAKSSGDFLSLQSIIERGYSPLDYRYYLLGGHYRSRMSFSFEAMDHAKNSLDKIRSKIKEIRRVINQKEGIGISKTAEEKKERFLEAVNDDLNTAKALSILWETVDSQEISAPEKLALMHYFDQVFGLDLTVVKEDETTPEEIKKLADKRLLLRKEGKWEEADTIREQMNQEGYTVKDIEDGYRIESNK